MRKNYRPLLSRSLYSIFFAALLLCPGLYLSAQLQANKPNTITQAPAATGTLVTLPGNYLAGTKVNYVRTWDAVGRYTDIAVFQTDAASATGYQHIKETTQYLDGLGRPLQTVSRQASPGSSPNDMVAPVVYDAYGRETVKYLPYTQSNGTTNNGAFKMNAFTDQDYFYKNVYKDASNQLMYAGEQALYGRTEYEASPLNRVSKTFAPGNTWAGSYGAASEKSVSLQYLVNITPDAVQTWNISSNALTYSNNDETTNIPQKGAIPYGDGTLYKTVSKDEQGNAVVEYKDKEGKVILKKVQSGSGTIAADFSGYPGFLCTYYIYDDLGQLRFVIPPKAVAAIQPTWTLSPDVINELCFRYEYDARQRMIAKKVPGAGWVYMVYDTRDRLVFTQDANMRSTSNKRWMATLYDDLNRPVITGMITYEGSPSVLQTTVNTLTQTPTTPNTSLSVDLTLSGTNITGTHPALRSISMINEFETGTEFTAEIVGGPGGPDGETTIVEGMAINKNPLPSGATLTALTITYYDNYEWSSKTYTTSYNSNLDAGTNLHAETLPAQANMQVRGMVTGSKTRVIEDPDNLATGAWLSATQFYDDHGRVIQSQADNYKGGTDIVTNRYDFSGKVLGSYAVHNNPAATQLRIKTNMEYDHAGRLLETSKTINDESAKKALIAKNSYDELGQLKEKQLGKKKDASGSYTSEPLEKLDYTYNIRGWLKGINKYYANNDASRETDRWFGMELNYDWGFNNNQYNGNIGGTKWRSKGDQVQRAYGFSYDKVNRLMGGDFSQYSGTAYADNATVNFDMMMGDGTLVSSAYDENGNMRAMKQWGLKITGSSVLDDMRYTYTAKSNKLKSVTDFANDPLTKLGDFKTNTTHAQAADKTALTPSSAATQFDLITDYDYDLNGNLQLDNNKAISSITYNHLNLPSVITVAGKGTISYTYDAAGNKLKKITHEDPADANNNIETTTTILYMAGMVYESKTDNNTETTDYTDKLQFFGHEEGRIRPLYSNPATPNAITSFVYDYMIKDHLGNVRMVLTEETAPPTIYQATMETANRADEIQLFTNIPETEQNPKPAGFDSDPQNPNQIVSKLFNGGGTDKRVGPGIVLKVMAGDKFKALTKGWYLPTGTDPAPPSGATSIINSLIDAFTGGLPAGVSHTGTQILTSGALDLPVGDFITYQGTQTAGGRPKAYLNWMILDEEQFKLVDGNYGAIQIPAITGTMEKQVMQANNGNEIAVKKNGYLYVYVSNESQGSVYFDDVRVEHTRSSLIEEMHYYPFGLTMAGISSKALAFGKDNKYKFNGIEQNNELDLNMYDAFYRNLDPQTGRFWQPDPVTTYNESLYATMQNNPISKTDWLGDYFTWANSTVENTFNRMREENSRRKGQYFGEALSILQSGEKGMGRELEQLATLINMHSDLENQWEEMDASDVEFYVSSEMPSNGAAADADYSMEDKQVNIRLGKAEKDISTMAHEFRHGYGYLNGEKIGGGSGLADITDEVVANQAGFLLSNRDAVKMVAEGKVNVEWFKRTHLNSNLYRHLSGKEVSLTLNTPAAVYMKYFDDRLSHFMKINKNNINMTAKDAIDAANSVRQSRGQGPEFRYGDLLKNR